MGRILTPLCASVVLASPASAERVQASVAVNQRHVGAVVGARHLDGVAQTL